MTKATANLILFGAPGAGKGTQAKMLSERRGFYQLSTGDLVRAEIASGSKRGQELAELVNKGKFPSDDIIIALMKDLYETENLGHRSVIFDGFPRTENQARVLGAMLQARGLGIDHIVVLDVDAEVVKQRILNRFSCDQCGAIYNSSFKPTRVAGVCDECGGTDFTKRDDDTAEAIDKRLETYRAVTQPVLDFYQDTHRVVKLDGSRDPDVVFRDIESILD